MRPKPLRSQIITTIITTAFRIFLMVDCIGMYLLISQSMTPITTKMSTNSINDIVFLLSCSSAGIDADTILKDFTSV